MYEIQSVRFATILHIGSYQQTIAGKLFHSLSEVGIFVRILKADIYIDKSLKDMTSDVIVVLISEWNDRYRGLIPKCINTNIPVFAVGNFDYKTAEWLYSIGVKDCSIIQSNKDDLSLFCLKLASINVRSASVNNQSKPAKTEEIAVSNIRINTRTHQVLINDKPTGPLTLAEMQILLLLISEPVRVFTRSEVFDSFQHSLEGVNHRSLDSHIYGLRKKLGKSGNMIQTLRGRGYRLNISDQYQNAFSDIQNIS